MTTDSGDEEIKCWRSGSAAPADFPSYRTSPNRGGVSPQETDPVNRCVGRALTSSYGTFCLTFFIDIMHL